MQKKASAVENLRKQLAPIPNLWFGIEHELTDIGIRSVGALKGRNARELTIAYCASQRRPFDEVIEDTFSALVRFADDGVPTPWWQFTRQRAIQHLSSRSAVRMPPARNAADYRHAAASD